MWDTYCTKYSRLQVVILSSAQYPWVSWSSHYAKHVINVYYVSSLFLMSARIRLRPRIAKKRVFFCSLRASACCRFPKTETFQEIKNPAMFFWLAFFVTLIIFWYSPVHWSLQKNSTPSFVLQQCTIRFSSMNSSACSSWDTWEHYTTTIQLVTVVSKSSIMHTELSNHTVLLTSICHENLLYDSPVT